MDPIEAAAVAAAETRIMRPNGHDMPALSAIACGLNDYREDRRYAVAAVRQIARAAIAAYGEAHAAELLRGFGDPKHLADEVERQAKKSLTP